MPVNLTFIVGRSGHAAPFARRMVERGCLVSAVPARPGDLAALEGVPHRSLDPNDESVAGADLVLVLEDRDDGKHHLELAQPALEAGTPLFIDKPLAPGLEAVERLITAASERGTPLMSTSAARYAAPVGELAAGELGELRSLVLTGTGEVWFYGVHLAEIAVTILGPGFGEVHAIRDEQGTSARVRHRSGTVVTLDLDPASEMGEGFGMIARSRDGFRAASLTEYGPWYDVLADELLTFARTRQSPVPLDQTMAVARLLDGLERNLHAESQGSPS